MSWRGIVTVLLLIGAALSGWALWSQRSGTAPTPTAGSQSDYVLNHFELIALDDQGDEAFSVRAPRLARDPDTRTLDIATPRFLIPAGEGSQGGPWEVRSRTGWVSAQGDELRLRGDVVANSTGADGRPVTMTTEQLNVFPESRRATSEVAVTLRQPGLIINGRDLDARLDTKRIVLQDTQTRYESTAR
ncbi:MAG: LPS export ABC transporter periplasmic protein LptC [Proteobacteria bacterium]|nr:LPS export ABC transporter periplasmic protein LptC [Pseudomonadota bacterium]